MDDFRRKPLNRLRRPQLGDIQAPKPTAQVPPVPPQSTERPTEQLAERPEPQHRQPVKKRTKKKVIAWAAAGLAGLLVVIAVGLWGWYQVQMAPVDTRDTKKVAVTIAVGTTPAGIAETLKENKVIRSEAAFLWYARLAGVQNNLQAGTYRLSPAESTPEIVDHLVKGRVDTFTITFLPGNTLAANRQALLNAGYSAAAVDAALRKTYTSPLFEGKPATSDLEGYVYGETYTFGTDATVEQILEHTFEAYYAVVKENNLVAKFQQQGLSLYEGIILASIIQREASQAGTDMPEIAEVFYNRLRIGMPLGSDVTYQYIADKTGVARDPNLDSPYNTRRYGGLPPGPIATPGVKALKAAAAPATGDYYYFLSGDDNITYFGRTFAEHEANIRNHCQEKCQIL